MSKRYKTERVSLTQNRHVPWRRVITERGVIQDASYLRRVCTLELSSDSNQSEGRNTNNMMEIIYYASECKVGIQDVRGPCYYFCYSYMTADDFYELTKFQKRMRTDRFDEYTDIYTDYNTMVYRKSPLSDARYIFTNNQYLDNVYVSVSVYFPGGVDLIVMDYISCWQTF